MVEVPEIETVAWNVGTKKRLLDTEFVNDTIIKF